MEGSQKVLTTSALFKDSTRHHNSSSLPSINFNHRAGYFTSFSELTISVCPFISGAGRPGGNTRPARK